MDHNRQLLLTTLRAANSRLCLLAYVLSKQTSVTYISTVNIIEMGPGAVASCSEIRHDPKDESPPGGLSQRRLALQGESQVIYRKVEEHEERSGRGRGFEVWHLSIWECWRGGGDFESSNHRLPPLLPWRCNSIPSAETHKAQWGYQVAQSAFPWWKQKPGWHQPNQLDQRRAHTHAVGIQKSHALIQHINFSLRSIYETFTPILPL